MPGIALIGRNPSLSTFQSKEPKQLPLVSAEHNEFAQPSGRPSKKGFVGFLKRLRSSTVDPGRSQCEEQRSTSQDRGRESRRRDSSKARHLHVQALMGPPKEDDDVFNNALVRTHANSSDHNLLRPTIKSEFQSMFSGATCFKIAQNGAGYTVSVETVGDGEQYPDADDIPGTSSFDDYLRNQGNEDAKSDIQLWDNLLNRVFANYTANDEDVPRDSKSVITRSRTTTVPNPDTQTTSPTRNPSLSSHPFGPGAKPPTHQEFTTPIDTLPVLGNAATLESLSLLPAPDSGAPVPTLTFTHPANRKLSPLNLALLHNVQFVASHPCFAPAGVASPRPWGAKMRVEERAWGDCLPSDFLAAEEVDEEDEDCSPVDSACSFETWVRGSYAHPLHERYGFEVVPAACLISMPGEGECQWEGKEEEGWVVVFDARGSESLELLVRAWCARVGEHAVVSKAGRTCIACSVREARALGFGVVIRI